MDLIWLMLFALLCGCIGGLVLACDHWFAPRSSPKH